MAQPLLDFFHRDGTLTITNGSDLVTGTFTGWDTGVLPLDFLVPGYGQGGLTVVKEVVDATTLKLPIPWTGPTLTDVPYVILRWASHLDPRVYAVKLATYLTKLRAIPDDLDAFIEGLNETRDTMLQVQEVVTEKAGEVETARAQVAGNAQAAGEAVAAAQGSAGEAAASLAQFLSIYYGALPADPPTRPNGSARQKGDFYWNATVGGLRIFDGASWVAAVFDANGALVAENNLSDLTDPAEARENLGLGKVPNKTEAEMAASGPLADAIGEKADAIEVAAAIADITPGDIGAAPASAGSQPGDIKWWPVNTPPAGWLKRNGASLVRTEFPALFAVIGTTFGAADSTHFSLPDDRGLFERGWDDGRGLDSGRVFGSEQADALQDHGHSAAGNVNASVGGPPYNAFHMTVSAASESFSTRMAVQSVTGGRSATETRPRNRAYLPIIKY